MMIRSRRVVLPDGVGPAAVEVAGGRIAAVRAWEDAPDARDVGDAVIMPGLVDAHVHLNEPGRTEWEGFASATAAAAAGGITTLVDMPLNSIPATTTAAALAAKRAAAEGQCHVDVGFWGGVVPGNAGDLPELAAAGARGFKCFLVDSGVAEFPAVAEADLRLALPILARLGLPLLAHAELPGPIAAAVPPPDADPRRYTTYLASRPAAAEEQAIALLARLCRDTGARVHVVHLSAASALPLIAGARAEGLPFTAETCPHYLHFAAEDVPDGATPFKCAPPIRGRENRERLWAALADGTIGMVVSDHSPCTPALKRLERGDFGEAWGGIAGLQLALPVVWTEASRRGRGLADLVRWMSEGPARLAGLDGRKGRIAPGHDADLVVWRPEARFRVDPARIRHRHHVTPYAGEELTGVVDETYVRGVPAGGEPRGMLL
jgi:allantoinase